MRLEMKCFRALSNLPRCRQICNVEYTATIVWLFKCPLFIGYKFQDATYGLPRIKKESYLSDENLLHSMWYNGIFVV